MIRKGSRGKRPTFVEEALRALEGKPAQGTASPAPVAPPQRSVASIFSAQSKVVFSDSSPQDSGKQEPAKPAAKAGVPRQPQPDVTVRKPVDEVLLAESGAPENAPAAGTSEATQNVLQEDIISQSAAPPPIPAASGREDGRTVIRTLTPGEMAQELHGLGRAMGILEAKLTMLESTRAYTGDLAETNKDIVEMSGALREMRDEFKMLKSQANAALDLGKTLPHVKQSDVERKHLEAALSESLYDALLKTPVGNEEVEKRFRNALEGAVKRLPDVKVGKSRLKDVMVDVLDACLMPMMRQMAYHVDVFRNVTREVLIQVGRLDDRMDAYEKRLRALEGKIPKGE